MSERNEDETVDGGLPGDDENEEGQPSSESPEEEAAQGEANEGEKPGEAGGKRRRRRKRKPKRDDGPPPPMDERTENALSFVQQVLDDMDMECDVQLRPAKPEEPLEIQLEITGPDSGRVIGKKGQVLAALQYLTNRVVNRPGIERRYVTVDAEGYRSRRDDTLATMARRLGKQAVEGGKIITFEPMNPRDRRVIHLALAKFEGVITKSEGEGDDRRVQIIPVRR
jgi:spoIIIJ-associated protein